MATREQALVALLSAVKAQNYFVATGRRARDPTAITPALSPACFLVVSGERIRRETPAKPPIRTLLVSAFLYNDAGPDLNVIPETGLNGAMEALEAALAPDDAVRNACTLGGLVYAAYLNGEPRRAPAEITGKALAIAPIEIILP
jgi:hypothetical protein